ncbi:MAG: ClC family H(+)/Cl(-) exchange transporter, partial [Cetobacterium somerae]
MSRKREIKNHVELLQKGNRGLYGLSLLVGVITGVIVSIYRYGLGIAGNLREHYISRELLTNPSKLLLIWGIFIVIGLFVDY